MRRPLVLLAAGLVGQAVLLTRLADLQPPAGVCLVVGAAFAAAVATGSWRRLTGPGRSALAMWAAGGFGMTLGWWADLDFASAAALLRSGAAAPGAWCGLASAGGFASIPGPHLHLLSWMNVGMLAAGAFAMRGARRPFESRSSPRASFTVEAVAMVLGMSAGAVVAARVGTALPAAGAVVAAHALMNVGMLVAMRGATLARAALQAAVRCSSLWVRKTSTGGIVGRASDHRTSGNSSTTVSNARNSTAPRATRVASCPSGNSA